MNRPGIISSRPFDSARGRVPTSVRTSPTRSASGRRRSRRGLAALVLMLVGFGARVDLSGSGAEADPVLASFRLPSEFAIERVAEPPLVARPMFGSFDDQGRLYVADSGGLNLAGADRLKQSLDCIRVLEDTNADGVFDQSRVFADNLVFAGGAQWYDGAVYVASPPGFWRLRDTRGGGVADERRALVGGFGNLSAADFLHGGSLGPDGRLYWCMGRGEYQPVLGDGAAARPFSGPSTLRLRPDGTDFEIISGAQEKPVGIAFTLTGDLLISGGRIQSASIQPDLRDTLIEAIDGGEFAGTEPAAALHPSTGDPLPALTQLGVATSAGLICYQGGVFGQEYRGNLFTALAGLHEVRRQVLTPDGGSFRCRSQSFLTSTRAEFHPLGVIEDADGSLLVLDTGGWFQDSHAGSLSANPEVKGGIYRVTRRHARAPVDPRGRRLSWATMSSVELTRLLGDERFAVRDRVFELFRRQPDAVGVLSQALATNASPAVRLNIIWALTRLEGAEARIAIRQGFRDPDPQVRQVAARSAGLDRDELARVGLESLVLRDVPAVRREAAIALGRIRNPNSVPALLEGLRLNAGRLVEHALILALIQTADREATLKGLGAPDAPVRRGALIALDQMEGGNLTPEQVVSYLDPAEPTLAQTAQWILEHHQDWGGRLRPALARWLNEANIEEPSLSDLKRQLLALSGNPAIQELMAEALRAEATPTASKLLLLELVGTAQVRPTPESWVAALRHCLGSQTPLVLRSAAAAVRGLPIDSRSAPDRLAASLVGLARNTNLDEALRVEASGAVAPRLGRLDDDLFAFLAARLEPKNPPFLRAAAAAGLGASHLDERQLDSLSDSLAVVGPLELRELVRAYAHGTSAQVGAKLVGALEQSPASSGLNSGWLSAVLGHYPPEVRNRGRAWLVRTNPELDQQQARLADLATTLPEGDYQQGYRVFYGARAACSTCHTVSRRGGRAGPDLSQVGARRSRAELLEAIVFPDRVSSAGYEPFQITTREGVDYTGVIGHETPEAVYLITSATNQVRLPRSGIESVKPGPRSLMPGGFDRRLQREELADLVVLLSGQR